MTKAEEKAAIPAVLLTKLTHENQTAPAGTAAYLINLAPDS